MNNYYITAPITVYQTCPYTCGVTTATRMHGDNVIQNLNALIYSS